MSQNLEKLKRLLAELFQLDQAELDFGIYRIMNAKREEITRFLDDDLLPQVRKVLQAYAAENRGAVEAELAEAIEKAKELGADPESLPRVKELRAKLAQAVDLTALENEVYSHLYNFFRRYYSEGDFISLRRYKEGVYAIPYEGEEVKLYWANHDQYYIKTSEYLRNYTFKLPSGKRVHFKLVQADTEKDNNRPTGGNERRFILSQSQPLAEENGELVIRFEYRSHPDKAKQADLNAAAVDRILRQTKGFDDWRRELASPRPTEKNPNRTLLEKHLTDYTARNTFDYFIHKDLGGFLRRELDFYIKNEVMHLDDIENETAPRVEQYLAKIKAIRRIAHKVIDFLAQLENFQKKLWLKKKFVVETQYCVTLDRVPEELYPEIAANDAQREEWVRLFAIDEIKGDLMTPRYSVPLTVEFLKANPYLVLDTRHFGEDFKRRLLASFDDLDEQCDGLLIHSENFQALSLLVERYRGQVKCVYIDPPYNTSASAILYKNDYKHSSWLALITDRIGLAASVLEGDGMLCIAIDDSELSRLHLAVQTLLGADSIVGTVALRSNPAGRSALTGFSVSHDYAVFISISGESVVGELTKSERQIARYSESDNEGRFEWVNFRKHGGLNANRFARPKLFYPIYAGTDGHVRVPEMKWNEASRSWVVLENPTAQETVVWPIDERGNEKTWKWGHETATLNLSELTARPDRSGKLGVYMRSRMRDGTLPPTIWHDSKYSATDYGTNLLGHILGNTTLFSFPKSIYTVIDSLRVCNLKHEGLALDFFAGSGTTAHAVINLNREDGGRRKYILVEMGEYFDTVLVPRIKKVVYSKDWKDGKPVSREGVSHMFKVLRLESYEDTLNNLELRRTEAQQSLLEQHPAFREDYMLHYMLDVESRGSASLLNLDRFEDPFSYKLNIATGTVGETKPRVVDLVETFNYLIGLRVKTVDDVGGVRVVTGTNPQGERVLVLWRNTKELTNDKLDNWFRKQGYNTRDQEYDVIYVNGDNNLENLKRPDQTWKVRLIEEEFLRRMFDVQDV